MCINKHSCKEINLDEFDRKILLILLIIVAIVIQGIIMIGTGTEIHYSSDCVSKVIIVTSNGQTQQLMPMTECE